MLTADAIQQRRKLRLPALFYASYKTAQWNQMGEVDQCANAQGVLFELATRDVALETPIGE
jgi:hypothetical protein